MHLTDSPTALDVIRRGDDPWEDRMDDRMDERAFKDAKRIHALPKDLQRNLRALLRVHEKVSKKRRRGDDLQEDR